jgi:hypothetical protein
VYILRKVLDFIKPQPNDRICLINEIQLPSENEISKTGGMPREANYTGALMGAI